MFVFVTPQTPFTLTLRLWDIFILEGERLLTAMSYTVLKTHKSEFSSEIAWVSRHKHTLQPLNNLLTSRDSEQFQRAAGFSQV